jgi:hypothetical protein
VLCREVTELQGLTRITRGNPNRYMDAHYAAIARLVDRGVIVDMD